MALADPDVFADAQVAPRLAWFQVDVLAAVTIQAGRRLGLDQDVGFGRHESGLTKVQVLHGHLAKLASWQAGRGLIDGIPSTLTQRIE
jgi:hypothetical protein